MAYAPNNQQQQIIDAALTGKDGVIVAGAGTGKTSTLRFIAEAMPKARILYVAYNKTVQLAAAASFPKHVTCRTAHSLAYRTHGAPNKRRTGQYPSAKYVATALGIMPFKAGEVTYSPKQIAVAVKEAVGNFCTSSATQPMRRHVEMTDIAKNVSEEYRLDFVDHVLTYTREAWRRIEDPSSTLPFMPGRGDNCYLKLFSLTNPQLGYDVILYDEAQDANPATAHIVEIQKCQKIMVGDSAQAIYGWNGAVDAMKNFKADWRLELSQSYRFGQAVADQANRWLNLIPDAKLRLTGYGESSVASLEAPSAILCRTNAGCIESAMDAQARGLKVAIAGGVGEIEKFVKAANDLIAGFGTDHPELAAFRSWGEVEEAVKSGDAKDIATMVRLVTNYGVGAILDVCENSRNIKAEDADVTVSTAHKAKGLEWDHVRIHGDFQAPKDGGKISVSEAMLIYVAVTRAKRTLDNSALGWLDALEAEINEAMEGGE